MKISRINGSLFIGGVLLLSLAACIKEVNDDLLDPPTYSEFGTSNLVGKYFITNTTSSAFKIPLGITTVAEMDRTIQLTIASPTGATAGIQYNAPTSIVIPAGKALDSLVINGLFSGYPAGRRDTLVIKITGGDVPPNSYNNTYMLVMQKYCDVDIAALGGNYVANEFLNNGSFNYGPYPTAVINLVSTGSTSASGQFVNLYDFGWNDISFTMDWSDPANFKISVPLQATGISDPAYVKGSSGRINTFSSCDQSFTISLDFLDGAQALEYPGYQFRLQR